MIDDELLEERESHGVVEYWGVMMRRRRAIVLPLFFCWVLVWAGSWLVPSTYKSTALILVEQQKVPEQYVLPNVTVSLQDRLQSMTQQILSRTRLQATIDRFHLYQTRSGLEAVLPTEDAVEQMRKDIQIELVDSVSRPGALTAFKIAYSARSPQLAQQVNSQLTSLFIDENLKLQQELSESTTAFLQSQLAEARAKLEEQETKVRAFKAQHFGDLPSQTETNVQILSGLQAQLQATQRALDTAKQQKLYLESLQQQYQDQQAKTDNSTETSPEVLAKELESLRLQLQDALSRFTEEHPDVTALKDKIARTEKLKRDLEKEIASRPAPERSENTGDPGTNAEVKQPTTTMMQLQSQLKSIRLEIQNDEQHLKQLESQIASYRDRLTLTPQTEQQLADVSRGYEESKSNYNSLLQKQNQSQLATSLEQRQQGAQFRILDPPSLPDRPTAPNHLLLSLAGLLGGSILGLGLAVLLEMTNVRVRQEKDLEGVVTARILVGIPHLNVPGEERFQTLFHRLEIGIGAVMALLIVAGNLFALYKG
jgi:polysaccharide chain length determinant protein (PEP-CTERM system associated)